MSNTDFWHVPWLPPPPGQTSNLIDPESRAKPFIIILSIFLFGAIALVMLRLYVRLRILQSLWWDDGQGAPSILQWSIWLMLS